MEPLPNSNPTNNTDTQVNDNGTAVEILFNKNRSINATDNDNRAHNPLALPNGRHADAHPLWMTRFK